MGESTLDSINLNLGSSVARGVYKRSKNWINIDLCKYKGVNLRANLTYLPISNSSVNKIHCIHVLEHLTRNLIPIAIEEMSRVLVSGGTCFIEVPNFPVIVKKLVEAYRDNNQFMIHKWRTSIYGKTERPGMAHHFGFDKHILRKYMLDSGFRYVHFLKEESEMISNHYKQEPVLLAKGVK